MSHVDFPAFDADNHYYEAEDAFTRHIDPKMAKRCMQWAEINGRKRLLVGGQINRFIPNPTWDPIARPGSLDDYFRGRNEKGLDIKEMFGDLDPLGEHPEYQDRDKRLALMDAQGLEGAYFFPTLGVGMQQSLAHDIEAVHASFRAFNRWLAEDWGFAYQDRIFAAPMISMADPELGAAEVEWAIDQGARIVVMVPGPVPTETGSLSPANERYDPVWARIAEAGITVGIHGGDGGQSAYVNMWEPAKEMEAFRMSPFRSIATSDRQIGDTFAAMVCHGLFHRFPRLRIASIENGAAFVPKLFGELKKTFAKMPHAFTEDPIETFKRHVWVSPYYEDDMHALAEFLGTDHLLFGSDYPHAEGLAEPTAYINDISSFGDDDVRKIMRDNAKALLQPV